MNKKSYYVTRNDDKKLTMYQLGDVCGYEIKPKVKKNDAIEVSKIIFVDPDITEKLIRKKIDKKIEYLLKKLKEEDDDDEGGLRHNLMESEKLRVQIINNYRKYLGNTYSSLTLEKIKIIINEYRVKLWNFNNKKMEKYFMNMIDTENNLEERNSRRGR